MKTHALLAAAVMLCSGRVFAAGIDDTLFLQHFDAPNADPNYPNNAGDADYAAGSPSIYTQPPPFSNAPGGAIVSTPAKFGAGSVFRSGTLNGDSIGGLINYDMGGNFNLQRGTIDMWVNSGSLSSDTSFRGLFGTYIGGSFAGDIRMYVYNTGAGRTLGAYMIDDNGAAQHWETEGAIPAGSLTNDAWHHVAWEWDLASHQSFIYWDGHKLASGATNGKTIEYVGTPNPTQFQIGSNQAGSGTFPGYIDEFRISDVMRYNGASFTPPTSAYVLAGPSSTWITNGSALWTDPANWSGAVPQNAGDTAIFGSAITAAHTITLDAPMTVGHVQFDNVNAYAVNGTNTLTFQVASGNADITITSGSHSISAPISLISNTNISGSGVLTTGSIANSANLDIQTSVTAGDIDGAGGNVTVDVGKSLVADRIRQNSLTVNGTAAISAGRALAKTSVVSSLAIGRGATLNLADNDLVIDYTGESPAASVGTLLAAGFAGGAWNGGGIDSSVAASNASSAHKTALGFAEAGILGVGSFSGQTVDSTALLVRYTYAGDSNLDGKVNSLDFTALAANFNQTGGGWVQGDFNYDGVVNALDFNVLALNFGLTLASPPVLGSLVPEPSVVGLMILSAAFAIRRRTQG